tara:strand:- start:3 stop:593 length:591 start_codon:yes stop_codon:yes gene_type:complete
MTHYRNLMASCGIVGLLFLCVFLSACAGIIVGGAATSAVVANDPRTTGTFVEDQSIELKAAKRLNEDTELKDQTNINVTSYNQVALVSGQAPTASLKKRAVDIVSAIEKIRHVHDEIEISAPSSMMSRTNDTVLTTKVKTKLFANDQLNAAHIKVVSETGTVYLLGLVSNQDAALAAEIASTTGGVRKVVKLFEQL